MGASSYYDFVLQETANRVGTPPRGFSLLRWRYARGSKPEWLNSEDLTSRIYEHERTILDEGQVRWGAVIHANSTLLTPGTGTSGAQVVYSLDGKVSFGNLVSVTSACAQLKGTKPDHPDELRLADMLTDEYERALDWPIPKTIAGDHKLYTTIVMTPRELLPGRVLVEYNFPILVDVRTKMAVLVPSYYWEPGFRKEWHAKAKAVTREWKEQQKAHKGYVREDYGADFQPVSLTEAAEKKIQTIIEEYLESDRSIWVRIGVNISKGKGSYTLAFDISTHAKKDYTYEWNGFPLVVAKEHIPYLEGTVVDYKTTKQGTGFAFDNPNAYNN